MQLLSVEVALGLLQHNQVQYLARELALEAIC